MKELSGIEKLTVQAQWIICVISCTNSLYVGSGRPRLGSDNDEARGNSSGEEMRCNKQWAAREDASRDFGEELKARIKQ